MRLSLQSLMRVFIHLYLLGLMEMSPLVPEEQRLHLAPGAPSQTHRDFCISLEVSNSSPLFNNNEWLVYGIKWQFCGWGGKWSGKWNEFRIMVIPYSHAHKSDAQNSTSCCDPPFLFCTSQKIQIFQNLIFNQFRSFWRTLLAPCSE